MMLIGNTVAKKLPAGICSKGYSFPGMLTREVQANGMNRQKASFTVTAASIRQLHQMPPQHAPVLLFLSGTPLSMYHTGKSGIRLATGGLSLHVTAGKPRQPLCGLLFLHMAG